MHDGDDHEDFMALQLLDSEDAEDIEGIEKFTLYSVGIDIGSSTTHTIFSRLVLRREGAGLSAKFVVTNRDVLYRSPIMLTPYSSGTTIDTESVRDFIERSYEDAGFTPDDVDTGAVVITGEALKKENAQPILEYFSEESGRFICASAGPMHEALLAAFGSGAVGISKSHANSVLDVDMGGGTTKISLIRGGEIAQMVAIEVGARLIAYDDDDMTITRVEQPARTIMSTLGHELEVGAKLTEEQREQFAEKMTDILFDLISGGDLEPLTEALLLTEPLNVSSLHDVDHVVFSGGVSEYVYDRTSDSYGDIGPWLGRRVRERAAGSFQPGVLITPAEGIRATVIGAGEYTLQASGSTSYISTPDVLPVRGVQVARAFINKEQTAEEMESAIAGAVGKYDLTKLPSSMVLAMSISGQPDYWYIRRLAESIIKSVEDEPAGAPVFLVVDVDVAKSLGGIIKEELGLDRAVIAIDGIEVGDLDYVDVGRPMGASEVIPVTVKSLVFSIRSQSG